MSKTSKETSIDLDEFDPIPKSPTATTAQSDPNTLLDKDLDDFLNQSTPPAAIPSPTQPTTSTQTIQPSTKRMIF